MRVRVRENTAAEMKVREKAAAVHMSQIRQLLGFLSPLISSHSHPLPLLLSSLLLLSSASAVASSATTTTAAATTTFGPSAADVSSQLNFIRP